MEQNGAFFPYCHARHLELLTDATFVFTSIKHTADFCSLSIFNWQTDPNVLKLRERFAAFTVTPNIILTGCRLLTMILVGFAAFLHPQPPHVHMSRDSRRACLTEWVLSGADAHNADRAAVIFGRTMFQLSLLFHNLRFKSLASNMYHAAAVKKRNKCEAAKKKASFLPDGTVTVKWEPVDSDLWRSRLQWAA